MEMQLIRKTEKRVVYKIDNISRITNEFIERLNWPENIRGMIIIFDDKIENEYPQMSSISCKNYVCLAYSAHKGDLLNKKMPLPNSIRVATLKDFDELKRLYYETKHLLYESWKECLGDRYLREVDSVVKNYLPSAKVAYLTKNGKPAALLTVIKWKDYTDIPVDWITWVWIDDSLQKVERLAIRCYFAEWLRANIKDRVQCVVNSFNIRSQKFFRKLGFSLECVHIVKTK